MYSKTELEAKTVAELNEIAKEFGIKFKCDRSNIYITELQSFNQFDFYRVVLVSKCYRTIRNIKEQTILRVNITNRIFYIDNIHSINFNLCIDVIS